MPAKATANRLGDFIMTQIALNLEGLPATSKIVRVALTHDLEEAQHILESVQLTVRQPLHVVQCVLELAQQQLVLTVAVRVPFGCAVNETNVEAVDPRATVPEAGHRSPLTVADLVPHMERALQDYHSKAKLACNPLAKMLPPELMDDDGGRCAHPGVALRRVLDSLIDAESGLAATELPPRSQWRLEHYVHLRYRQEIQHKELASWLGYSERHLQRLRREQTRDLAELLLEDLRSLAPYQGEPVRPNPTLAFYQG